MTGELAGVPSVGVMTTAFVDGAELMARALGVAGYGFAVIEHPISSISDEELAARARATLDQAATLLLAPGNTEPDVPPSHGQDERLV